MDLVMALNTGDLVGDCSMEDVTSGGVLDSELWGNKAVVHTLHDLLDPW